jgi:hypothetical protein
VILDGKKDEALRILLQKRLIYLGGLDSRRHLWCFWRGLDYVGDRLLDLRLNDGGHGGGLDSGRNILLVHGGEVELLRRRVAHLEVLKVASRLKI